MRLSHLPVASRSCFVLGSGCLFPGLLIIIGVTPLIEENIATIPLFIAGKHGSLYFDPVYLALN